MTTKISGNELIKFSILLLGIIGITTNSAYAATSIELTTEINVFGNLRRAIQ